MTGYGFWENLDQFTFRVIPKMPLTTRTHQHPKSTDQNHPTNAAFFVFLKKRVVSEIGFVLRPMFPDLEEIDH